MQFPDTLTFLCFLTSQYFFSYNSYIIEHSEQLSVIKNFSLIVKDPLVHVGTGHKQHTIIKSKWHEQEMSLEFKLGQTKFHRVMVANKLHSIGHVVIVCIPCLALYVPEKGHKNRQKQLQTLEFRVWSSESARTSIQ